MKKIFKFIFIICFVFYCLFFIACNFDINNKDTIDKNGVYISKDEVALYIHTYNKLPKNYYTKENRSYVEQNYNEENKLSIGGDIFYNYEQLLPQKKGRIYYECDIDYDGKTRGPKRIVFSNDGLIYYTDDHYNTFTRLY